MVYRARVYRRRRSRSSPACIRRAAGRMLRHCSCSRQPARAQLRLRAARRAARRPRAQARGGARERGCGGPAVLSPTAGAWRVVLAAAVEHRGEGGGGATADGAEERRPTQCVQLLRGEQRRGRCVHRGWNREEGVENRGAYSLFVHQSWSWLHLLFIH
jgi:hypothetical protein